MIRALYESIQPVIDLIRLHWYRWALSEIHPLHPDVPLIVTRINELERSTS